MKPPKSILCICPLVLCIFFVLATLASAEPPRRVDAYVTDWTDNSYLIKNVRSDFQPNDPLSFYAYYGASTLTIPFSNIKRIIVTDRVFLNQSKDFSEAKYYSSGEIVLKNDEFLQCSWISHGWKGYNKYDGLIFIEENSWKEVKFGRFNTPRKKAQFGRFIHPTKKAQFGCINPPKKRVKSGRQGAYPYTIHVSSFKNKHVANSTAKELREKGFPAFVCPVQLPYKGEFHRIFIGFYGTFRETKKAALKLIGIKNLYPLEAKMPYAVEVGTFDSDQKLKKLEADLRSKTYLTYAVPDTTADHQTKLLFGAFRSKKETAKYAKMLRNDGFEVKVVRR